MSTADVVVVGSGPAGAITAAILAEAGMDVLVLEEGPWIPVEAVPQFSLEEMALKYRHAGAGVALGRPNVAYVEGRCAGGGSEINSGLYHRTPDAILEQWQSELGLPACSAAELDPYFSHVEHTLSVGFTDSGRNAASQRLQRGAESMGWRVIETPRWIKCDAHGHEERQTVTRTLLPRVLGAGGRLWTESRVDRIARRRGHWSLTVVKGVTGRKPEEQRVSARDVFICAGAIQSPTLLRRSRLSKAAGRSLRMHATAKVTACFPDPVNSQGAGVPAHQVKEFAPELTLGCSISEPAHLHMAMVDVPGGQRIVAQHWQTMATYYAMVRSGNGSIWLLPGCEDPLVRFSVGTTGLHQLLDGMAKLSRCLFAAGATRVFPSVSPGMTIHRDDHVEDALRSAVERGLNLMTIHLMGSCPMGVTAARSVTGPFGEVWGHPGLRVNDASLLPGAIGVNPQGTIMALAARNTHEYLSARRG